MRKTWVLATIAALVSSASAYAETSVTIGMSGWTGFAPLTLAKQAGIFEKNGLKVDIKKIPQASHIWPLLLVISSVPPPRWRHGSRGMPMV